MLTRLMPILKGLLHLLCLAPFVYLVELYRNGTLALNPDPVNLITHFTGDWALWLLLADLAITPLRRLHPALAPLVRVRRMVGLYAFFYASLHLATYVFLFSGYDVPTAWTGLKSGHPMELWRQFKQVWPTMLGDVRKRRFIQVGFTAWTILLALAVTSPLAVLRAMGGKNWQRLHRLIYVAAIAAVIHYWWLVKTGVRTPWKVTAVLVVLFAARVFYRAVKRQRSRQVVMGRI
ncbi:MAG TPA: protein-methionine-sulfoxide reductase heme-binding subunit MsrQ [Granulicella sp.]|jgi:sulfoxide reductase heme-binding subunit YedZ|nr:protein-methionine-sulfoxide reductase heme-binding subunit MsrQ [Granulicella sp.]